MLCMLAALAHNCMLLQQWSPACRTRHCTVPCCIALQGNIGIAFDLMSLNLADLPRAPLLVGATGLMFAEPEPMEEFEGGE